MKRREFVKLCASAVAGVSASPELLGEREQELHFYERVNLVDLYTTLWGDAKGARLVELGLFCDTDETGASSLAYFADIRAETAAVGASGG